MEVIKKNKKLDTDAWKRFARALTRKSHCRRPHFALGCLTEASWEILLGLARTLAAFDLLSLGNWLIVKDNENNGEGGSEATNQPTEWNV